ncbi:MAG: hypothetical protein ACRDG3_03640 [Tepidiformaceae bacterium]
MARSRTVRCWWILIAIAAFSALAVACGGGKPAALATATSTTSSAPPTITTPLASATTSPTPDNASPALYPAGYRSGVANVDSVMAILEKADGTALAGKVQLRALACTNLHSGTSGPPPCENSEPEGAIVHVFMTGGCEPNYQREPQASDSVRNFGSQHPYQLAFAYTDTSGPAGAGAVYVGVGTGASDGYATVILGEGGSLIGITNCGGHISAPSDAGLSFVVPPP